jgi:hypothetical protein
MNKIKKRNKNESPKGDETQSEALGKNWFFGVRQLFY